MNNLKATATLFLDNRRKKSDGTFPVKLTIYFSGEKMRYKTGIDLTEEEWQKINSDKLRDDRLKTIKRKLNDLVNRAEQHIDKLPAFSYEAFEETFFENKSRAKNFSLESLFRSYAQKLEDQGRIGTAEAYLTAMRSILTFKPKASVTDVTAEFLEKYEVHMYERKSSPSTIGIYLRHLRAIINLAIDEKLLSRDKYPFSKYSIPSSRNVKKALSMDDLKALMNYKAENENQARALAFWLFSYYCNGMNMKDICLLKWADIDGDFLFYYRAKTKHTKKKDLRPIKVVITEQAKAIIDAYGSKGSASYVFDILSENLTAKQADERVHSFIKFVNKFMDEIRKAIGITVSVTTYAARHSHATVLKRKGASTEIISENLGHSSLLMTKQYLDDFTDDVKKEYANLLTNL